VLFKHHLYQYVSTCGISIIHIQSLAMINNSLENRLPNKVTVPQIHF